MKKFKNFYYITPAVTAVLIFISNFLSTNLFSSAFENFAVWFIISILIFACGWFINTTFGWIYGSRVLFAVISATAAFSVFMVFIFREYFGLTDLLVESLLLYSLRNIFLGSMGFFGMAISENIIIQKEIEGLRTQTDNSEKIVKDAKKEAHFLLENAKIKAEKIIFEAQKKSTHIIDAKNKIERDLREFIQAEREILSKYEKED